jgi:deoxyribodipyrimidine photo-lyase
MKCRKERVSIVKQASDQGVGAVLYLMNRDCRIDDNWAYVHARETAQERGRDLIIGYYLEAGFLGGGFRQHKFKIEGLKDVQDRCDKIGHSFHVWSSGGMSSIIDFCKKEKIGLVVTDMSPLRIQRQWLGELQINLSCGLHEVDAHNCIPVWVTSPKREFAARTIRPKISRLFAEYLEEFPKTVSVENKSKQVKIDWEGLMSLVPLQENDYEARGGYVEGEKAVSAFIQKGLKSYSENRNDPLAYGQSDFSPYLHYGHIAPARIALEVIESSPHVQKETAIFAKRNAAATDDSVRAFLEELVVRRELADNFCFHAQDYDKVSCFPDWSKRTIEQHKDDSREYLYTKEQFEFSKTHDDLWNAAQRQMVISGKMHGYVRMYWAKKILQWTPSAQDALDIAIYLNDRYEIDGRDPNGYAGITWSVGGVHDRAWFGREIFGTIRYMAISGMKKKFDVDAYIHRWSGQETLI